jgi:hypothetical protein
MADARGPISTDDQAAMQYLYPRNEQNGGAFGCGTINSGGQTRSLDLILLAIFIISLQFMSFISELLEPLRQYVHKPHHYPDSVLELADVVETLVQLP